MSTESDLGGELDDDSISSASQDAQLRDPSDSRNPSLANIEDFIDYHEVHSTADDPEGNATSSPQTSGKRKSNEIQTDHTHHGLEEDLSNLDGEGLIDAKDRPNRFLGPASTWRSWTDAERDVLKSLDQDRAQDLSIHLFNSFALKIRAKRQQRLFDSGVENEADKLDNIFKPPKVWTAWPLPPDEVPRESTSVDFSIAVQGLQDSRPSAVLEEIIIARAQKLARERLRQRDVASSSPEMKGKNLSQETRRMPEREDALGQPNTTVSDKDDCSTSSAGEEATSGYEQSIVPLSDDDQARTTLLPIARHTLNKLEDLLTGLHTIRSSYALKPKRFPAQETSETGLDSDSSENLARNRKRKLSRAGESKTISILGKDHVQSSDSKVSPQRAKPSTLPNKSMRSSHKSAHDVQVSRLGLRDWSEVIGTASLTGWSNAAVERAAERCSRLFDQDQLFRTFHERSPERQANRMSFFTEHTASGIQFASDEEPPSPPNGWLTATEGESEVDTENERRQMKALRCPYKHCQQAEHMFYSARRLRKHIEQSHPLSRYDRREFDELTSSEGQFGTTETEAEKTHHCPVVRCKRAKKPFSRLPNLYNHIRKRHEEIDVDRFKKLQVRKRGGERRGKWNDARRRRSRKRGSSISTQGEDDRSISIESGSSD
ncbi:MAG: hypothetical protein Q9227_009557 [Pyrenula ochraceoflavens]